LSFTTYFLLGLLGYLVKKWSVNPSAVAYGAELITEEVDVRPGIEEDRAMG
jgi:uncharacterized membrane-anchored protein